MSTIAVPEKTSGFGVFFGNVWGAVSGFMGRHKLLFFTLLLITVSALLYFREEWQPYAVLVRRFITPIVVSLLVVALFWVTSSSKRWWRRALRMLIVTALVVLGFMLYDYVALWNRYDELSVKTLSDIPPTGHERIQPLDSVHQLGMAGVSNTLHLMPPAFVRDRKADGSEEFRWTMAVEPSYGQRFIDPIESVYSVSATDPAPNFGQENKLPVRFAVGEGLRFSSNAYTVALRSLGPFRFWSYEATDVRYMRDDAGKMVEVISFLRWNGLLLPYPEFGGVLVIRQQPEFSLTGWISRMLFGEGEWVRPERVKDFPYLRGQNLLPHRVSTYIAESMRFRKGALAPTAIMGHDGDVRVPVLRDDVNHQPYATYFEATSESPGMIYHYFALEPFGTERSGLALDVLVPGDGSPDVYVVDNEKAGRALKGVSNVPTFVRNSVTLAKIQVDWSHSAPIEHRPWVKKIDGQLRRFWLSTIVTYKDEAPKGDTLREKVAGVVGKEPEVKRSLAGDVPSITLTDQVTGHVEWVNPLAQDEWVKHLSKKQ